MEVGTLATHLIYGNVLINIILVMMATLNIVAHMS